MKKASKYIIAIALAVSLVLTFGITAVANRKAIEPKPLGAQLSPEEATWFEEAQMESGVYVVPEYADNFSCAGVDNVRIYDDSYTLDMDDNGNLLFSFNEDYLRSLKPGLHFGFLTFRTGVCSFNFDPQEILEMTKAYNEKLAAEKAAAEKAAAEKAAAEKAAAEKAAAEKAAAEAAAAEKAAAEAAAAEAEAATETAEAVISEAVTEAEAA